MGQDEEGQQLNLKIRGGDGEEVVFKVKKTTAFSKIFTAYCQRKGVQIQACRFVLPSSLLLSHSYCFLISSLD